MKKYVYWGTTAVLAIMMIGSGTMYFVAEGAAETFARLGFPDYFRVELGIAKILGAVALLAPVPRAVKEWTYAGFTISFVSALVAHAAVGDPASSLVPPAVALALLVASYATYHSYVRASAGDEAAASTGAAGAPSA